MKLIVTVVKIRITPHLLEKLLSGGYPATRLASTSGFCGRAIPYWWGLKTKKWRKYFNIEETCRSRKQTTP